MITVCTEDMCTGCMACVDMCPTDAISIQDSLSSYNAIIDEDKCIECNKCRKVCQVATPDDIIFRTPVNCLQGWAENIDVRMSSSSGGIAAAVSRGFVEKGGCVCSCTFRDGVFCFDIADDIQGLKAFAGSKYVKSNPSGMYGKIEAKLKSGIPVLLIALPCQIAAARKLFQKRYDELFYTIDLICHGTPSPEILSMFLEQHGYGINKLKSIYFRKKTSFALYENKKEITPSRVADSYTFAFLRSLDYTDNCYSCKYARLERVSDLTIGDAWGNTYEASEQNKGVSLILSMTDKGRYLLECADLHLEEANLEIAVNSNHQLKHPSIAPIERDKFMNLMDHNGNFEKAISKCYPKFYHKQKIKLILSKLGMFGGGGQT